VRNTSCGASAGHQLQKDSAAVNATIARHTHTSFERNEVTVPEATSKATADIRGHNTAR
jgi:hypothetical protein